MGEIVTVKSILAAFAAAGGGGCREPARRGSGVAGDWAFHGLEAPSTYTGEVGLRFWYGKGNTGKNLYDPTGASLVSRLSYDNLSIFSAEAYGRFDLNTGWFLKGLIGGGGFRKGTLTDEDFPPGISPYSATLSTLDDSFPVYASVDVGYNVFRGSRFPRRRFPRLQLPARGRERGRLRPDRDQSVHLRILPDSGDHQGDHAGQQLEFVAGRARRRGRHHQPAQAQRRRRLAALGAGSTAPTRIGCASATFRAISAARCRRTAPAGAISSRGSCPTG